MGNGKRLRVLGRLVCGIADIDKLPRKDSERRRPQKLGEAARNGNRVCEVPAGGQSAEAASLARLNLGDGRPTREESEAVGGQHTRESVDTVAKAESENASGLPRVQRESTSQTRSEQRRNEEEQSDEQEESTQVRLGSALGKDAEGEMVVAHAARLFKRSLKQLLAPPVRTSFSPADPSPCAVPANTAQSSFLSVESLFPPAPGVHGSEWGSESSGSGWSPKKPPLLRSSYPLLFAFLYQILEQQAAYVAQEREKRQREMQKYAAPLASRTLRLAQRRLLKLQEDVAALQEEMHAQQRNQEPRGGGRGRETEVDGTTLLVPPLFCQQLEDVLVEAVDKFSLVDLHLFLSLSSAQVRFALSLLPSGVHTPGLLPRQDDTRDQSVASAAAVQNAKSSAARSSAHLDCLASVAFKEETCPPDFFKNPGRDVWLLHALFSPRLLARVGEVTCRRLRQLHGRRRRQREELMHILALFAHDRGSTETTGCNEGRENGDEGLRRETKNRRTRPEGRELDSSRRPVAAAEHPESPSSSATSLFPASVGASHNSRIQHCWREGHRRDTKTVERLLLLFVTLHTRLGALAERLKVPSSSSSPSAVLPPSLARPLSPSPSPGSLPASSAALSSSSASSSYPALTGTALAAQSALVNKDLFNAFLDSLLGLLHAPYELSATRAFAHPRDTATGALDGLKDETKDHPERRSNAHKGDGDQGKLQRAGERPNEEVSRPEGSLSSLAPRESVACMNAATRPPGRAAREELVGEEHERERERKEVRGRADGGDFPVEEHHETGERCGDQEVGQHLEATWSEPRGEGRPVGVSSSTGEGKSPETGAATSPILLHPSSLSRLVLVFFTPFFQAALEPTASRRSPQREGPSTPAKGLKVCRALCTQAERQRGKMKAQDLQKLLASLLLFRALRGLSAAPPDTPRNSRDTAPLSGASRPSRDRPSGGEQFQTAETSSFVCPGPSAPPSGGRADPGSPARPAAARLPPGVSTGRENGEPARARDGDSDERGAWSVEQETHERIGTGEDTAGKGIWKEMDALAAFLLSELLRKTDGDLSALPQALLSQSWRFLEERRGEETGAFAEDARTDKAEENLSREEHEQRRRLQWEMERRLSCPNRGQTEAERAEATLQKDTPRPRHSEETVSGDHPDPRASEGTLEAKEALCDLERRFPPSLELPVGPSPPPLSSFSSPPSEAVSASARLSSSSSCLFSLASSGSSTAPPRAVSDSALSPQLPDFSPEGGKSVCALFSSLLTSVLPAAVDAPSRSLAGATSRLAGVRLNRRRMQQAARVLEEFGKLSRKLEAQTRERELMRAFSRVLLTQAKQELCGREPATQNAATAGLVRRCITRFLHDSHRAGLRLSTSDALLLPSLSLLFHLQVEHHVEAGSLRDARSADRLRGGSHAGGREEKEPGTERRPDPVRERGAAGEFDAKDAPYVGPVGVIKDLQKLLLLPPESWERHLASLSLVRLLQLLKVSGRHYAKVRSFLRQNAALLLPAARDQGRLAGRERSLQRAEAARFADPRDNEGVDEGAQADAPKRGRRKWGRFSFSPLRAEKSALEAPSEEGEQIARAEGGEREENGEEKQVQDGPGEASDGQEGDTETDVSSQKSERGKHQKDGESRECTEKEKTKRRTALSTIPGSEGRQREWESAAASVPPREFPVSFTRGDSSVNTLNDLSFLSLAVSSDGRLDAFLLTLLRVILLQLRRLPTSSSRSRFDSSPPRNASPSSSTSFPSSSPFSFASHDSLAASAPSPSSCASPLCLAAAPAVFQSAAQSAALGVGLLHALAVLGEQLRALKTGQAQLSEARRRAALLRHAVQLAGEDVIQILLSGERLQKLSLLHFLRLAVATNCLFLSPFGRPACVSWRESSRATLPSEEQANCEEDSPREASGARRGVCAGEERTQREDESAFSRGPSPEAHGGPAVGAPRLPSLLSPLVHRHLLAVAVTAGTLLRPNARQEQSRGISPASTERCEGGKDGELRGVCRENAQASPGRGREGETLGGKSTGRSDSAGRFLGRGRDRIQEEGIRGERETLEHFAVATKEGKERPEMPYACALPATAIAPLTRCFAEVYRHLSDLPVHPRSGGVFSVGRVGETCANESRSAHLLSSSRGHFDTNRQSPVALTEAPHRSPDGPVSSLYDEREIDMVLALREAYEENLLLLAAAAVRAHSHLAKGRHWRVIGQALLFSVCTPAFLPFFDVALPLPRGISGFQTRGATEGQGPAAPLHDVEAAVSELHLFLRYLLRCYVTPSTASALPPSPDRLSVPPPSSTSARMLPGLPSSGVAVLQAAVARATSRPVAWSGGCSDASPALPRRLHRDKESNSSFPAEAERNCMQEAATSGRSGETGQAREERGRRKRGGREDLETVLSPGKRGPERETKREMCAVARNEELATQILERLMRRVVATGLEQRELEGQRRSNGALGREERMQPKLEHEKVETNAAREYPQREETRGLQRRDMYLQTLRLLGEESDANLLGGSLARAGRTAPPCEDTERFLELKRKTVRTLLHLSLEESPVDH
ncbi:conserved hypothetical protein [Neospora caninum Liverpool]|uniref:Uncharacterized protein n=1 Tax=Neospora caninum (strain Liverpool) TaxID=572307 RepID=F0V8D7_NEOCL|nr:conserved hypothetical protein [Neospora caninum Liverpool]CBZ49978.1 conserved hypothetical protein [Neospora caninum Liverpool]|eukprot:XP_003880013.1 conserved hypothetical protein [Neospora caninum Liverpool]